MVKMYFDRYPRKLRETAILAHLRLGVRSGARCELGARPETKLLMGPSLLCTESGHPDLAKLFWDPAVEEMGDIGLDRIQAIWSKAGAAREAHADSASVDFPGVLGEIQDLCLEINPGLGERQ